VVAIPLIAIFAAYFGILAALIAMTRGRNLFVRAALVGLFVAGIEWLRGDAWYLRFPWYTVPHALAQEPACLAPVRWLGTYGFSFAIWFIVALGVFGHYAWWAALALFPAASLLLPAVDPTDRKALLIQTEQSFGAATLVRSWPSFSTGDIDLVVLPEYAYPVSPEAALASKNGPAALAHKYRCPVIFGAKQEISGSRAFRNVAVVTDARGKIVGTFTKQLPVPLFVDGIPGTRRPVFPVQGGILGVAVCYDFDAPEIANSLVGRGATVLVAPTFDAMSWGHAQHVHHELLVRLRAVENDRWILRTASSGRSEAVNPHGEPSAEGVEIGKEGIVVVGFAQENTTPPGSRLALLGPAAAFGTLTFLVGYVLWAIVRRRRES
jgi:apolipoprotein N-acyltransferase